MLTAHRRPNKPDGLLALTTVTPESFPGRSDISHKPTYGCATGQEAPQLRTLYRYVLLHTRQAGRYM